MYLTHHSGLKTEGTDVVIGGPEVLIPSSEYETLFIFVAGDKCSQSFGGVSYRKTANKRVENEIQELHAKEVGVGNPSEERASS
jgi:hypothetical protein